MLCGLPVNLSLYHVSIGQFTGYGHFSDAKIELLGTITVGFISKSLEDIHKVEVLSACFLVVWVSKVFEPNLDFILSSRSHLHFDSTVDAQRSKIWS